MLLSLHVDGSGGPALPDVHASGLAYKGALPDGSRVILEGVVHAICRDGGDRIPMFDVPGDKGKVLAGLFAEHGVAGGVDRIEGRFVGVVVLAEGGFTLFADRYAKADCFYARAGGRFVASTEFGPVAELSEQWEYDQAALSYLLGVYGYTPPKKHTIYKEIKRLGVGERLVRHGGSIDLERTPFVPERLAAYGEAELDEYADLLLDAVRVRSSSRMNWLCFSSGFDSSGILASLVCLHGPDKVRCVIGRMKYSERSNVINVFEVERAGKIAEHFGVPLDIVDFNYAMPEARDLAARALPRMREGQVYSPVALNFQFLGEHVARYFREGDRVFCGEVSDGAHSLGFSQFATILEHPDQGFREYSDKMASYLFGPGFFKRCLDGNVGEDAVYELLKGRCAPVGFHEIGSLCRAERKREILRSFFHRASRVPFIMNTGRHMLRDAGRELMDEDLGECYLEEVVETLEPETVYSTILHLYNSYHWQCGNLKGQHSAFQALCGTSLRYPYWDGRLISYLARMPENFGRGLELRPTKYPLKWALEHRLNYPMHLQVGPHSYLYDVNPEFSHASEFLFASELAPMFKQALADKPYRRVLDPTVFKLDYLDKIVDDYVAGKEFAGHERTDALSLAMLCWVGWHIR